MTRNEAAERLRDVSLPADEPYADNGWYASGWHDAHTKIKQQLPDALAAERRATVERIRERFGMLNMSSPDRQRAGILNAILDEEAARDTQLSQPDGKVRS